MQQRLEAWKRKREEDAHVSPLEALQRDGDTSGSLCGLEAGDCHLSGKGREEGVGASCHAQEGKGAGSGSGHSVPGKQQGGKVAGAGTGSPLSIEADCQSGPRESDSTPASSSDCKGTGSGAEGQQGDAENPLLDAAALHIEVHDQADTLPAAQGQSPAARK